jgi:hypothetical protein
MDEALNQPSSRVSVNPTPENKIKKTLKLFKNSWKSFSKQQKSQLVAVFALVLGLPIILGGVYTVKLYRSGAATPPVTPPTTPAPTPKPVTNPCSGTNGSSCSYTSCTSAPCPTGKLCGVNLCEITKGACWNGQCIPNVTPTPTPSCKVNYSNFVLINQCNNIQGILYFRYASFVCADGSKITLGGPTSCKTQDTWKSYAANECTKHPNCSTPTPTPYVRVITPNGGESLTVGQRYKITWNAGGLKSYDIYILNTLGQESLINGVSAPNSSYDWLVVNPAVTNTGQYKIKIVDAYQGGTQDQSDGYFTILQGTPSATPKPYVSPTPTPGRQSMCKSASISSAIPAKNGSVTMSSSVKDGMTADHFSYSVYNLDNLYGPGNPKPVCVTTGGDYSGNTSACPAGTHQLTFLDQNTTTARQSGSRTISYANLFVTDKNNNQPLVHAQINAYFQLGSNPISLPEQNCVLHANAATPTPTVTPTPIPTP